MPDLEAPYGSHQEQYTTIKGKKQRWRQVTKQYCPVCQLPSRHHAIGVGYNPAYKSFEVPKELSMLVMHDSVMELKQEEKEKLDPPRRARSVC